MKKELWVNSTLTLLTIFALSACSNSGGKSPEVGRQKPPVPEVEKKEEKELEQQINSPVEKPKVGESKVEKPQQPQVIPPAEKPQIGRPQVNQPKIEKPQQLPIQSLNDKNVFNRLSLYDKNGVIDGNLIKLIFNNDNKKIELTVLSPHSFVGAPKIETLRDGTGALVGYYGYAKVSEQNKNIDKEDYSTLHDFYLQGVDQSLQQRPVGVGDIKYSGKMLYQYDVDSSLLEARVSAIYHTGEKKMSMDIHDNSGGVWNLHQDKMVRSSNHVNVNEGGSVGGYLFFKNNQGDRPKFNGNFSGRFYGKDGSVLTGRASYEDRENGWEGVIGATAEKADKSNP